MFLRNLHVEQEIAVYREGPVLGGGQHFQLIGNFPGGGHAGDDGFVAVYHGLHSVGRHLGQSIFQFPTGISQGVGQGTDFGGGVLLELTTDAAGRFFRRAPAQLPGVTGHSGKNLMTDLRLRKRR